MSRIEMAMEKAARLREEGGAPIATGQDPAARATNKAANHPIMNHQAMNHQAMNHHAMNHHAMNHQAGRFALADQFLVNLNAPQSPTAEEYRKLKTVLVKLTEGDYFRNTIQVTSTLPCEGKSLTALNLALSLAQEFDHTVLLIDADLRRPSVHRYLGIEQGPGLAELLLDQAEVGETLVATGIGKLSVMRAGCQVDNPAELLSSQKMKELLEELKNRYPDRYVILDSAPVLPFAEPRSLAQMVDGVIFVIMERLAQEESIREALDSLKGSQILGFVYNAASQTGNLERYAYYHDDGKKQV